MRRLARAMKIMKAAAAEKPVPAMKASAKTPVEAPRLAPPRLGGHGGAPMKAGARTPAAAGKAATAMKVAAAEEPPEPVDDAEVPKRPVAMKTMKAPVLKGILKPPKSVRKHSCGDYGSIPPRTRSSTPMQSASWPPETCSSSRWLTGPAMCGARSSAV